MKNCPTGKVMFRSYQAGVFALINGAGGERVYQCHLCKSWHTGHARHTILRGRRGRRGKEFG